LIEEMMIGEDKVIRFSGCKKDEACTIILRGASSHIIDEAERSLLMLYVYFVLLLKTEELSMVVEMLK